MLRFIASGVSVIALGALQLAEASDFKVNEHSASDLGRANSGQVTQTDDASLVFGNPALMAGIKSLTVTGVASGVFPSSSFRDEGSVDLLSQPLGGTTDSFSPAELVPAIYLAYPVNDRLSAGFAIHAPYGTTTKFDAGWPGRYQALTSELKVVSLSPAISYKISDGLSVGGGLDIQNAKARLTSAVDFGAVCFAEVGPATCSTLGLTPLSADGLVAVEGDDWRVGYTLGAAWTPMPDWTFGATYHSQIDHKLAGNGQFTVPAAAALLQSSGAFADAGVTSKVKLPSAVELGAKWAVSPKTTLFGDATWTNWSAIKELRVSFDNPVQADNVTTLDYKDAWRFGVGADYKLNSAWTLRGGVASDASPTNPLYQTARLPDNDRTIYALGASWTPDADWSLDLAYNRVDVKSTSIDTMGSFGDQLLGRLSERADVVSLGVTKRY